MNERIRTRRSPSAKPIFAVRVAAVKRMCYSGSVEDVTRGRDGRRGPDGQRAQSEIIALCSLVGSSPFCFGTKRGRQRLTGGGGVTKRAAIVTPILAQRMLENNDGSSYGK